MKSRINAAPGHSSLPQRRLESDAARRSLSTVAAGAGATPAAFYLGLCRLRGILSLPASHDHAAGGPFFSAQQRLESDADIVDNTNSACETLHRFSSLGLKSRIDETKRPYCRRVILLCCSEDWNRMRLDVAARRSLSAVAAGAGATPAAFYLGLCRLRGILSRPASHDHAAGGPFFFAAAKIRIGCGTRCCHNRCRRAIHLCATKIGIGRGPWLRLGQVPLRRLFT